MNPTVSVIIAAYKVEPYIEEAIQSVLGQTFQDFEIIVVDDCSPDKTADAVKKIKDHRVRLLENSENRGPSYSRNRGINESRGKWIAILDADDWWHENRLRDLLSLAEEKQAEIVCDDLFLINDGESDPWNTYLKSREAVIGTINEVFFVDAVKMIEDDYGYLQPLISSALIKFHRVEYENELFYGEDFRFLLECIIAGGGMFVTPQPMYFYRFRGNSLSTDSGKLIKSFSAQIESTNQLIGKYAHDKRVVSALKKFRNKKQLNLHEIMIVENVKVKKFMKALSLLFSSPNVIKSLLRKLIQQ
ncbi:glycosyltransferase family 2 protein [Paenibacillus hamazuiensis]|uniref:glycosyltransferase family 2 protein n=1 Tax=Paenibacillus hamazuiensis TaxID=2936508 RepID=UPI00200F9A67|nr:glycosyltransferase family 2 protein [Paenibacillus hamazuiensis]